MCTFTSYWNKETSHKVLHDLALEELVAFDVEARLNELNEKVARDLNILVCFQETSAHRG